MKKFIFLLLFSFSSLFAFEELSEIDYEEKIENKNVIIDFYSVYWPACKVLGRNIKKYSKNKQEDVTIYKVNVGKEMNIAKNFGLVGVPAIAYLKNGELLTLEYGIKSVEDLKNYEKKYFSKWFAYWNISSLI